MADEVFFLTTREWLDEMPDPASTRLFETFLENCPEDVYTGNEKTRQGTYAMTPDGEFLGAHFARSSKPQTKTMLEGALERWKDHARANRLKPRPIPGRRTPWTWGEDDRGRQRLLVEMRDLPRGKDRRPGANEIQREAFNRNWLELSARDLKALVPDGKSPERVSPTLFDRIARTMLKDNVRGQLPDWGEGALRSGELRCRRIAEKGGRKTIRFEGDFELDDDERRFAGELFGEGEFDPKRGRFVSLCLVAVGQRSGAGRYNSRENDLGPEPMGVVFSVEEAKPVDEKSR